MATDNWLKNNIDPLLASAAFRQDGLLIIVFDESVDADTVNGGGHVAALVISSKANQAFQSAVLYQHQTTLRVIVQGLGLSSFPGASATAPGMAEFFGTVPNSAPIVSGVSPTSGATAGGSTVTISGTGFGAGAFIYFGGPFIIGKQIMETHALSARHT